MNICNKYYEYDEYIPMKCYLGNERALVTIREKKADAYVVELKNSYLDNLQRRWLTRATHTTVMLIML